MLKTRLNLLAALVLGLLVGLLAPVPAHAGWPFRMLLAWSVTSAAFCVPVLRRIHRLDAEQTRARYATEEGDRTETDLIVVLASVASLVAIAVMLAGGRDNPQSEQLTDAVLTVIGVAASWGAIHTIYTLRYARHYVVNEPGCIDFNSDEEPRLSDFAYLAFTLGMTYQVSDTALKTPAVRSLVLRHTLLSYLFGTVIVASTLNLVVGLAG